VIFGGVQSIVSRLEALGDRDVVFVDEAHRVPTTVLRGSQYGAVWERFAGATKIGLTATPFRLDGGLIYGPGTPFPGGIAIQIAAKELIKQGFLSPLVGLRTASEITTAGVRSRCGEFVSNDLADAATCDQEALRRSVLEAIRAVEGRLRILAFAVSVLHAELLVEALNAAGETATFVHGGLTRTERAAALETFAGGGVRWLVNCELLAVGFDLPAIDAIACWRPTQSKALWTQIVGRGMRLAPGKADCLLVDFGWNILRHGDIDLFDKIGRTRERVERDEADFDAARRARELPRPGAAAIEIDPLTGLPTEAFEVPVYSIDYALQASKSVAGAANVVAVYATDIGPVRRWLCPEYPGGAAWHARRFAAARGIVAWRPSAAWLLGQLRECATTPSHVVLTRRGKFYEVVRELFEPPGDPFADEWEDAA
jgi:superfamily II DNA or RNA helicase